MLVVLVATEIQLPPCVFDAIGGSAVLANLGMIPDGVIQQVSYYADQVIRSHTIRVIRAELNDAKSKLDSLLPSEDPLSVLKCLDAKIYSPSEQKSEFDFADMAEMACKESNDEVLLDSRIAYGYCDFDAKLGGLYPCELTILAARPSIGKTALGLGIAWNVAKQGKRVSFVSCEMSELDLGHRLLSMQTGIPIHRIRNGYLSDEDKQAIQASLPEIRKITGRAWIAGRPTVDQVFSRARIAQANAGIDLLIVDHLGLLKCST